jgi:hypothetical protein
MNITRTLTVLATLLLAPLAAPQVANASPYAPDMRFTPAQKQQQRVAADKLQTELASALRRGERKFRVTRGDYRFSKPWPGTNYTTFRFGNVQDFTLDGQGARFFFESPEGGPVIGGFWLGGCKNVAIKNLTLDWDPVPFTQGTIVSANPDTRELVFKPDAGYEHIYPAMRKDEGRDLRIFVFDKATRRLTPFQVRMGVMTLEKGRGAFEKPEADGSYRLLLSLGPNNAQHVYTPAAQGIVPGASVAIVHRSGPVSFWVERCGPVTIENVTAHSGPMGFLLGRFGDGPIVSRRCKAIRPPGSDRLVVLNADCFNAGKMLHGPIIEDGQFEAACDDFLNIFGVMHPVFEQPAPNELIVGDFEANSDAQPTLHFLTLGDCRLLGDRKAVSMTPIPNHAVAATWGKTWKLPRPWRNAAMAGKTLKAVRVALDQPLPMPAEGMFFTPLSAICRGAVVRNNTFTTGVARGLLLQSHDVTVENNRFVNMLESAMILGAEAAWWGGAVNAHGVVIRGNHIEDTNLRAISHRYSGAIEMSVEGDVAQTDLIEDVRIENNTFVRPGGSAIAINGARHVRILNNTFRECGNLPWHGLGRQPEKYGLSVAVYAGEKIEQTDNKTERTGPYALDQ